MTNAKETLFGMRPHKTAWCMWHMEWGAAWRLPLSTTCSMPPWPERSRIPLSLLRIESNGFYCQSESPASRLELRALFGQNNAWVKILW